MALAAQNRDVHYGRLRCRILARQDVVRPVAVEARRSQSVTASCGLTVQRLTVLSRLPPVTLSAARRGGVVPVGKFEAGVTVLATQAAVHGFGKGLLGDHEALASFLALEEGRVLVAHQAVDVLGTSRSRDKQHSDRRRGDDSCHTTAHPDSHQASSPGAGPAEGDCLPAVISPESSPSSMSATSSSYQRRCTV